MTDTIHIAIGQYEFIEASSGSDWSALLGEAREAQRLAKIGGGLPTKEWNKILDNYLNGTGMRAEEHELMDAEQKWMIHELDKAFSRIKKD